MKSEELNTAFIQIQQMAYRYAVSLLRDRTEAEDVVQDLYLKLWRRRLLIRPSGFRALMMTMLRNHCFDKLREKERRRDPDTEEILTSDTTPETQESTAIIKHLIGKLPPQEREVIHLRDCEGWQFEDIAAVMGTSQTAVRMALSRARQKVREEFLKISNYGL